MLEVIRERGASVGGKEDRTLRPPFTLHASDGCPASGADFRRSVWQELLKVELDEFLPTQTGGKQNKDDRPVPPGAPARMHGSVSALPATAAFPGELG